MVVFCYLLLAIVVLQANGQGVSLQHNGNFVPSFVPSFGLLEHSDIGVSTNVLICNGASFAGQEIRVSFGMPCRPGACILQHKSNLPFNSSVKLGSGSLSSSFKENMPFNTSHHHHHHHMVQSSKCKGRHSHNLFKSVSDPNMTFLPRPLSEATGSEVNSLRPPLSPSLAESSDSFTQLTLAAGSAVLPGPSNPQPIAKSVSAPTVLTGGEESAVWGLSSSREHEQSSSSHPLLRKRPASESDLFASSSSSSSSSGYHQSTVYDKPYIGQHQQGIPFTHPLKRIRME